MVWGSGTGMIALWNRKEKSVWYGLFKISGCTLREMLPEGSGVAGTKWKVEHAMMVHEIQKENVEVCNKCLSKNPFF